MISDHYDIDDPNDTELTAERIELVQRTWRQIVVSEDAYEPIGLAILKEFFQIQPEALRLFSFKDVADPFENQLVKNHAKLIIQTFNTAIDALD